MTWQNVVVTAIAAANAVALAWIAAWQQRAAMLVRRLNGHVQALIDGKADELTGK